MQLVPASASGCAGDGGPPRHGRGGRAGAGRDGPSAGGGSAGHGGPRAGGGGAGPDDHRAGDLSQEEILDLVVEAMLAQGGPLPEEDDLADGDDGDAAGSCSDPRDAPGPRDTDEQDAGPGPGFGSGQPFDVLRPGPALAGAADRVHTGALRRVSDEELTGMIRAWRRLSSWATARELGAIAEFARRRPDEDPGPGTDGDAGPPGQGTPGRQRPAGGGGAGQLRAQRRLPSPAGRTRRLRAPPPAERPGRTRRLGVPRLPRLAGRAGQPRQRRLPRLPRLAG